MGHFESCSLRILHRPANLNVAGYLLIFPTLSFGLLTGKSSKSAKVFSALSWNWSLKSPQSSKEGAYSQEERDVGRSTSHCTTLEKLYAKEQRLYKEVKVTVLF